MMQKDAKNIIRTKERVIVTKSLRCGSGGRQDRFGATMVYVESKSRRWKNPLLEIRDEESHVGIW